MLVRDFTVKDFGNKPTNAGQWARATTQVENRYRGSVSGDRIHFIFQEVGDGGAIFFLLPR